MLLLQLLSYTQGKLVNKKSQGPKKAGGGGGNEARSHTCVLTGR